MREPITERVISERRAAIQFYEGFIGFGGLFDLTELLNWLKRTKRGESLSNEYRSHFKRKTATVIVCAQSPSRPILCDPMDCSPPGSLCPWDSPVQNTGEGCSFLLQGILLTMSLAPPALQAGSLLPVPPGKHNCYYYC